MKKRIALLAILLLQTFLFTATFSASPVYGESAAPQTDVTAPDTNEPLTDEPITDEPTPPPEEVRLIAPKTIRAGDTVTFTFVCSGTNLRAAQGSLTYNAELLTYVSSETVPEDWEMTFAEDGGTLKYLGLSTENRGISGEAELFTITFRVSDDAKEGNGLPFVLTDATVYNGEEELLLNGGYFTYAVSRPLSTECTLTALSVEGGNLSPSFSPDVTEYTITLPYTMYYADISATACEYGQIKFNSRELTVGENVLKVTVISESGLQQVYTIRATRLADPNYVPSADNRILSLELSDGLLFPAFSPEITEYSIYMVKGNDVTLIPTPADKAIAESLTIPSSNGSEGTYTIVCNAEDGTPRTYTFHTILLETPEELAQIREQNEQGKMGLWGFILILAFAAVTVFFLGFVVSHLFHGRKSKERPAKADPDQNT